VGRVNHYERGSRLVGVKIALTLAEHRGLVAAIEARNPEAARKAMEAHLDAVTEETERFSAKHPEVFAQG